MIYLTQLLPHDYKPARGTEIKWPGDDRIWRALSNGRFRPTQTRDSFDGGDCWEKEDD